MCLIAELCDFMKTRKKLWLLPIVMPMILVGALLVAVQGGAISELRGWHDVRTIETDGPWDIDTIAANLPA